MKDKMNKYLTVSSERKVIKTFYCCQKYTDDPTRGGKPIGKLKVMGELKIPIIFTRQKKINN